MKPTVLAETRTKATRREEGKFYNVLPNVHVFGLRPQIKKDENILKEHFGEII